MKNYHNLIMHQPLIHKEVGHQVSCYTRCLERKENCVKKMKLLPLTYTGKCIQYNQYPHYFCLILNKDFKKIIYNK